MGLLDVKQELKGLDKDQLIDIIVDLYKKNDFAKELLDFRFHPKEKELFLKYKDKVYEAFYPKRGMKLRLADGKKAISDFKKFTTSEKLLVDLMLFYVETGVKFTLDFGDIDEKFYDSVTSVYSKTLDLMKKENLLNEFSYRAKKIVLDTEGIGWGFHDELTEIHSKF